ncbi:MAG: NAD-dependent epimerase/dehydratase family protein [Pseudomonadota bacterium]
MSQSLTTQSVLVLGANGRLGRAVVKAFAAAGWRVLAQARRPLVDASHSNVRPLAVDLGGAAALAESLGGADVVVNAINPLYTAWDTEALPLARMAMSVALRLNATLIFPGNVYNFGASMPTQLLESTEQHPSTPKGLLRQQMERELKDATADGLRSIVLRAGDFIGDWGTGTWMDMAILKDLPKHRVTYPGPLDVVHSWANLPDLARSMVALAEIRAQCAAHALYHFPGYAVTGKQFIAELTQAARGTHLLAPDQELKTSSFPWPVIRLGGLLVPMWREISRMRYLWTVPHQLDGDKLAQAIGSIPHTPLEQALGDLLRQAGFVGTAAVSGTNSSQQQHAL